MSDTGVAAAAKSSSIVLLTLASGQFLMTLDSSVMNVSIATVAKDVDTTVTGIQTAITLYTLVMASLMITGGKVGKILGRKRAFAIGCVIYGCGSFTTSIAPSLPVLLFGWSFLEGVGAALILPAIVALVAGNFPPERRPAAYGIVAAAGDRVAHETDAAARQHRADPLVQRRSEERHRAARRVAHGEDARGIDGDVQVPRGSVRHKPIDN